MKKKFNVCQREGKKKVSNKVPDTVINEVIKAQVKENETHKEQLVSILGQEYSVKLQNEKECPALIRLNGYCDDTTHEIVVADMEQESKNLIDVKGDIGVQVKRVFRHEIIHAFLFESGIAENCGWDGAYNEEVVDWFAWQMPKIIEVCKKVGAL